MSQTRPVEAQERIDSAIDALKKQVERRYPGVTFVVTEGEDPEGVYLEPVLDIDDLDDVFDQELLDLLYEFQVEQELPVYVVPIWPNERLAAELSRARSSREEVYSSRVFF